jgi:hypothetical protein
MVNRESGMINSGSLLKGWGLLFGWLLTASVAWAASLTGELDKTEGTLEDQFVYTLSVQGNFSEEPEFPTIDGLEVQKAGTSQSVSIINGKFSREVQFQFVIVPKRPGSFTIPNLKLKVDGKMMETLPLEFKVQGGGSSSQADRSDRTVFVERTFSKQKVYLGETIVARIRIFNRVKLYGATPEIQYPDSFQVRDIDEQKNYTQMIGGDEYTVTELKAVLTPRREGRFDIDPAVLQAKISLGKKRSRSLLDDWMNPTEVMTKRFRSEPASIEVLPLPLEGRRADFSGLVGQFQMTSDLTPRALQVGETVTLSLQVTGEGVTTGMADPNLNLPWPSKMYRDKPQSQDTVDPEKGILGQRSQKIAIVPLTGGTLELGTLSIQYFDTGLGQYRDLTADLGSIQVEGKSIAPAPPTPTGDEETLPSPRDRREVETLAEDLVEPHAPQRLLGSHRVQGWEWAVGAICLGSGVGALGMASWFGHRRSRGEFYLRRRRAARAFQTYRKQLAAADNMLIKNETRAAIQLAQGSLKSFLGDKLSIPGGSLTLRDVELQLKERGLDAETIQNMKQVWQKADQVLFAPTNLQGQVGRDLLVQMEHLMKEVDRRC